MHLCVVAGLQSLRVPADWNKINKLFESRTIAKVKILSNGEKNARVLDFSIGFSVGNSYFV